MTWEAWLALSMVAAVIALLAATRLSADVVLLAGVTVLLVTGVLTPGEALAGLANPGLVTVGVLYVVAAGLGETGGIDWVVQGFWDSRRALPGRRCA